MKTKRIGLLKGIISAVFIIAMFVTVFTVMPLTASAANVSNTVYTSNLAQNDELVLTGNTTLFVNADLTLKSISGDYTLEIQSDGVHTLTVNNPNGCAISVKSLQSVAPSQGTVNLTVKGGSGYFAIAADGNISLDGVKLDITGSSGIRSLNGNVTINGTNVSVVCQDGVGVIANSGSISIDSDYLFVQCAGQSGDALWEHGIGAVKDITIISDDATITGRWGVDSDKGNITLSGNISVGATKCAIIANEGTITMTGSVTAQGGSDYYAIAASGDISFEGTKLDVKGSSGIRSAEGNISIKGTDVSVGGQDGVGVIANSGSIYIDSDYLFVQCEGQSGEAEWEHGIGAVKDITIISDDATITGRWGVDSDKGNITLSGNISVGATKCAIIANEGTITMTGSVTAQGGDDYYAIAALGDISFNGTELDVKGSSGIRSAEGDITINGTDVSVVGQDGVGVIANSGSIYIDSDYLFVQCAGQSGDAEWEHGIGAVKDITIISDDATITGRWGVHSDKGNITLSGNICVGATKSAIRSDEGTITMTGSVTAQGGDDYYAIVALGDISFNGTELDVKGSSGIRSAEGDITINGTDVSVVGQDGGAILANSGSINIDSDYLFVQCEGQSNETDWQHGVAGMQDVTIVSEDATIVGSSYGVYSENGNISLSGKIDVGANKYGIYAKSGKINMSGAFTVQSNSIGIGAQTGLTINGTLSVTSANTCIGTVGGDIIINANITATTTSSAGLLNREGNIIINGGKITVQGSNDGSWPYGIAATGNIEIAEGATVIAKGGDAIYSEKGNITIAGTVTALAYGKDGYGIYAKEGSITISGSATIPTAYIAISAQTGLTINGPVNATSTNTCIGTVDGDLIINADVTATTTSSAALLNRGGSITINSGTVDVQGGNEGTWAYGIAAYENIIIRKNAMVIALGGKALFAQTGTITIDQPLKIAVPGNGHIEGDTVVDTNGDSASHVEITNTISDTISISINAPVAGEKPVSSAKDVYGLPEHTSVKSIEWFVSDISHGNNEPFIAGQNYKVKIILKADAGYRFAYGIAAKLNGKDVTVGWNDGGKELFITYTFSDCPASIKNVELTVVAPSDGNSISYSVTDESAGYSAGNNSNYVSWYVSNDGVSYTLMSSGDKFVGGKYYKIEIIVKTHTGYEFALKDVGSIQPDVTATVNGFKATVTKGYEQDPSEEITVTYIFGLCNDTIIEDIKIVDVPKPIPGEKPVYTVAVSGTGYSIVNKNSSQEVFEGGKYVDKYYIRNGIGWYDVTADNWIYETDTFIAGHDYQCVVYIQTDDGYKFVQDLYADPEVWPTATVNGNAATILKEGSGLLNNQQVRYTFTYEVQNVTEVEVSDIDVPVGNKTPDYTATLGKAGLYEFAPYGYELVGFYWYDSNDSIMTASDKFVKGETYKLEIKLVRKMDGQRVLTQFQTPVTAVLNGKIVSSADVMANSTTVYIYQTYTCDTEYLIEIDSVSATIPNPLAGEKPDYDAIAGDDDKYTVTINAWYEDSIARGIGDSNFFAPDSYFIEGRSYHVKVTFTPKPGYKFADDVVFIINGQNATTWGREGQEQTSFTAAKNPKKTYLVTYSPTEGSGTMVGDVVAEGVSFTLDECEYVAPTGYKFKAWAIGSPSGEQMQPGQTIVITSETYLIYAVWEELPHTCIGVSESGQGATCTVDGWKDYYRCECGKFYEDENCTTLIADLEAWKIGAGKIAAAHSGIAEWNQTATTHEKKYTCCDTFVVEQESHEWNNGVCSECQYVCLHGSATKKTGQSATCTVDGWKDYYQCACGKYFADENCTTPITDLDAWKIGDGKIKAEHKYGDLIPEESAVHTQTQLKAGMKAHYECSVCHNLFDENKVEKTKGELTIPQPQHSYGDWIKDNEKHWKVCSCGLKANEGSHSYTDNADMICNDCGYDRTVPHTHGNGTKQDGQSATCTVNGWKDYYKCSCGKIYTDAACTNEITSFEEWKNGDGKIEASHNYGTLIARLGATCSATGMEAHYECSVCHTLFDENKVVKTANELTIAIDATAHSFGTWSSNGDGTHTRVCSLNAEHKETVNCSGGTATCTEKAICSVCNTAYGNTLDHNHGSEWQKNADEHWNECACGDKANKAAHVDSDSNGACDVCGQTMSVAHTHDYGTTWKTDANNHWKECECGEKSDNAAHIDNNGDNKCDTCDYAMPAHDPDTPDTPPVDNPPSDDEGGLGAGAIVGIVCGSVTVVGIGGFALFWFVIKKKSFADLIAVFKK